MTDEDQGEVVVWDNTEANAALQEEVLERPIGFVEDGDGLAIAEEKVSDTVFELDEWSLRKGREVFEDSDLVQKSYGDFLSTDDKHDLINMTSDFHAAAFEPIVEFAERTKQGQLRKFMEALFQTPEFAQLHRETQLDEELSEMATATFVAEFSNLRVKIAEQGEQDGIKNDIEHLKVAAAVCQQASGEVEQWRDMKQQFGLGGTGGDGFTKMPTSEIRKRFRRIRENRMLQRICQLAGKYRRFAQSCQRRKVSHGNDEVAGITNGNKVNRLIGSELALLADEELQWEVMRRLLERTARVRSMTRVENIAKGPIVVVVDESGSMAGEPIATAKAIALALYWIARHQKRWICMVGFSGGTQGNFLPIGTDENRMDELMNWLEHFYSGGTDMNVPLGVLPSRWSEFGLPKGKTDIVMITDAQASVTKELEKRFNVWKKEVDARCQGIVIGEDPGDLARVFDKAARVDDLGIEQAAVADALSI